MAIGVDLDGTLSQVSLYNPSLRLPWWFFLLLIPLVLSGATRKTVKALREFEKNGVEIVIISARPRQLAGLTKMWLRIHRVPHSQLFCVGFGKGTKQRKLAIIQQEDITMFIDDDGRTLRFLEENSVEVLQVNSFR